MTTPDRPRIGITGSAGTGKTTLAHALSRALAVPLYGEVMRDMLAAGFDFHSLTPDGHRALLARQTDAMAAALARADQGLVTDRTPLDFVAFWLGNGFAIDDPQGTEALLARAVAAMADYMLVVVLPWGGPIDADGIRSPNPWHQLHFQTVVEGLCRRWVPPDRLLLLDGVAAGTGAGAAPGLTRVLDRLGAGAPAACP